MSARTEFLPVVRVGNPVALLLSFPTDLAEGRAGLACRKETE